MEKNNFNFQDEQVTSLKDYINLIRNNILPILFITITSFAVSVFYAVNANNIYKSTTSLKVLKSGGNILESPLMFGGGEFGSDRFIANEIEILKSYMIRERVAEALLDSFKVHKNNFDFFIIYDESHRFNGQNEKELLTKSAIAGKLVNAISIEQKRGLDIVEISAESLSPIEAALIVNCYANVYRLVNLEMNRNQLTLVKEFLEGQRNEKLNQLNEAEEILRDYQERGGIIALDAQANLLINQLTNFESQKDMTRIELLTSDMALQKLKEDLKKQDPKLADYLESFSTETYLRSLQEQISKLEVARDLATSSTRSQIPADEIKKYNNQIADLRKKLDEKISIFKAGIFASSPEEIKLLTNQIITEELKNQSLKLSLKEYESILKKYEARFNLLPKSQIELAKLQRISESYEKLYLLVEEKFQEAIINEQSQPGNVIIVDQGRVSNSPSKPNRQLIMLVGLVLGLGISIGYVLTKNHFDNTVKTPEDIQKYDINVLAWIPQIEGVETQNNKDFEFIVARKPDSIPSEAFRALRTRVQFSKINRDNLKTILVTSSAPREGKTTVTVNLAGTFSHSNKKTLILDCDLRKPRVHNVFGANRFPGLVDYFFGQASLEEITRASELNNLFYITAGTIPPNPAELLESQQMLDFLEELKSIYDIILIDSPPIIAVTDSEVLSKLVDASILVVSANTTEADLMTKAVELIKNENKAFIGTVLNNFSYKSGYGSYYKYYYYYSRAPKKTNVQPTIKS